MALREAKQRSGQSLRVLLAAIGLDQATYHRWVRREERGELADVPTGKKAAAFRATPEEIAAVRRGALAQVPQFGA